MEVVNIIIFVSSFSWDFPGVSGADSAPRAHPQGGGPCHLRCLIRIDSVYSPLAARGQCLAIRLGGKCNTIHPHGRRLVRLPFAAHVARGDKKDRCIHPSSADYSRLSSKAGRKIIGENRKPCLIARRRADRPAAPDRTWAKGRDDADRTRRGQRRRRRACDRVQRQRASARRADAP